MRKILLIVGVIALAAAVEASFLSEEIDMMAELSKNTSPNPNPNPEEIQQTSGDSVNNDQSMHQGR
jgi:hypothetical protein